MSQNIKLIIYFFIAVCLFGYIVPWVLTSSSPLTLSAYDLAEWTTLHPTQPHTNPPLNIAFMLRLQLVIITLLIGLNARKGNYRMLSVLIIIPLAIAQLPPLDFVTSDSGNINYQQQFLFATVSLLTGIGLTFFKPTKFIPFIVITLSAIGIVTAIVGLNAATQLYALLQIEHGIGYGIVLLGCGYVGIIITSLWQMRAS